MRGPSFAATPASSTSSGSSSKPTRTTPCGPCTMSRRPIGVGRRVKTASARPSRTAAEAMASSRWVGRVMRGFLVRGACGRRWRRAGARPPGSSRGARRAARSRGRRRSAAAARSRARSCRGAISASKAPSSYAASAAGGGRVLGEDLAAAGAMVVHGRRGRHAVEPRAQVLGVLQARVRAQRAQQRVLHDVLGVRVVGEAAGVHEQLGAVGLDQGPERWQGGGRHVRATWQAART